MDLNWAALTLIGTWLCLIVAMYYVGQVVSQHRKNLKEHKAILVMALMAPIYGIVLSVLHLDFRGSKAFFTFLGSIKLCYEALVIAKAIDLLFSYLEISMDEIKGSENLHSFPMTLFQPPIVKLDHRTLKQLKYMTWHIFAIQPACTLLIIVLQVLIGIYPVWLRWTIATILIISVSSLTYLLLYSLLAVGILQLPQPS